MSDFIPVPLYRATRWQRFKRLPKTFVAIWQLTTGHTLRFRLTWLWIHTVISWRFFWQK